MWGKWTVAAAFYPIQSTRPPDWAREMHFVDGRNAKVLRCDDVGQSGSEPGFYLVTVKPSKNGESSVTVKWFPIF